MITYQGATISVYQPQVESWTGNQLIARGGEGKMSGKKAIDYGVIWITARTEVDKVNRMVTLLNSILPSRASRPSRIMAAPMPTPL